MNPILLIIDFSNLSDYDLRLWATTSGQPMYEYEIESRIHSLAISPDGKRALAGSEDGKIKLLELATGRTIRELNKHTDIVRSLMFSADGNMALSGSDDKIGILWDLSTGQNLRKFDVGVTPLSVAFSPDEKKALFSCSDSKVCLWDIQSCTCLWATYGGDFSETYNPFLYRSSFFSDFELIISVGGFQVEQMGFELRYAVTGELLATCYVYDEGLITITPDKYYDIPNGGYSDTHWFLYTDENAPYGQCFPLEYFKDRFHRPGLIKSLMDKYSKNAVQNNSEKDIEIIDVSEMGSEAGFSCPVYVTSEVWNKCVAWTDSDNEKQDYQEQDDRLWDVLFVPATRMKMEGFNPATGLDYSIYCLLRDGVSTDAARVQLKIVFYNNGSLLIIFDGVL